MDACDQGQDTLSYIKARQRVCWASGRFVSENKPAGRVTNGFVFIGLLLRPDKALPTGNQIVPREWHMYTILFDSYVQGEPNRDIMSKLYISEGTFHRTRRRALRIVAKALAEMEGGVGDQ